MALNYSVAAMDAALLERVHPAITRWNRLEGRPRTHDFDRALRAEVRDALWMLAKQWQMGEFRGDDAGSPVSARVCIDTAKIDRYQAAQGDVEPLDLTEPLEAKVERRPLPLRAGAQYLSLDLRMAVGRRWMKLLERERAAGRLAMDYRPAYLATYRVPIPDPLAPGDASLCAHVDAWRQASAAGARVMDGIAFLEYLANPTHAASDNVGVVAGDEPKLTALADELRAWFKSVILQPAGGNRDAWLPSRFEYNFGCSAPGDAQATVMRADEYHHGNLDWYALERHPQLQQLGEGPPPPAQPLDRLVHTFMPTSLVFEGMPNTRWWAFEDRRTNFGDVRPDTTDLGKLLLMEFALVYANDWFVLPYTLQVGTVTDVKGIALTNVFGERLWIEPLREPPNAGVNSWSLFSLSTPPEAGRQSAASRLVLLPTAPKVQESAPLEQVVLVRDEMANMVWGVERQVPLPSGSPKTGLEAARELRAFLQKPLEDRIAALQTKKSELLAIPETTRTPAEQAELVAVQTELAQILPPDPKAPIRYRVMNSVPENWIPFIPVHVAGSVRDIQLQRAALPRILQGAPPGAPEKVRPRTSLLRQGLPGTFFVHEEEVPRAGALVDHSWQRTRWIGGHVFCWLGARKQTGRGEGWSGLAFDQVLPVKPAGSQE